MLMSDDFPAAHSMDSCWFAVDREGHVGYFDTGEAGALPDAAAQSRDVLLRQLARLLPRCEPIYDLEGRRLADGRSRSYDHGCPGYMLEYGLFFLKGLDLVQPLIDAGRARQVKSSSGAAVIMQNPGEEFIKALHDQDQCLGCSWHFGWDRSDEEDCNSEPERLGLYVYGHLCENWISGPYGRETIPSKPLHIDQLPPMIRNLIKQLRFANLSFAETPHIQPVEHTPCSSWESRWLGCDGKEHMFDGSQFR
jgi:hypothetical protein